MQKYFVWLPISLLGAAVCAAAVIHAAWPKPSASALLTPARQTPVAALDAPEQGLMHSSDIVHDYRAHHIDVRSVPVRDGDAANKYLFFEGGPPDPLGVLDAPQDANYIGLWKNVILVRFHPDRRLDHTILSSWGDCGMRMGPYLLFGDPVWIARTREMLLQDGRGG